MQVTLLQALSPAMLPGQCPPRPRGPLPGSSTAFARGKSCLPSRSVTSSSALLRPHVPIHHPLSNFSLSLAGESLQVAVSPCWAMDLPDIISAVCAQSLGPLLRHALSVLKPASSRETPASRQRRHARRTKRPGLATSVRKGFRSCSHSLVFRFPCLLGPQVAPTATANATGQPGRLHHAYPSRLPFQGVISLHVRHGRLTWRDFHPLDRSLIGCSTG